MKKYNFILTSILYLFSAVILLSCTIWDVDELRERSRPKNTNEITELSGTVTINGIGAVGQTLTVNTSKINGSGSFSYQWRRSDTINIGSNSNGYIVQNEDVNNEITVTVTRSDNKGSITSDPMFIYPTPVANDFYIDNLSQIYGNTTDVIITPKAYKSTGSITIFYNGITALPVNAGSYTVTFNVDAAEGWNAAIGLAGGTLTINKADGVFHSISEINTIYTENMTLSNVVLPNYYTWINPAAILHAGNNQIFSAVYTDPSGNYAGAGGNITINVAKGIISFGNPPAINITYSPTLTLANLSLPSGYEWNEPTTRLNAGNGQQFSAIYHDLSNNYETVSGYITVNVEPTDINFPQHPEINITYSPTLTLANLSLQSGYEWNEPTTNLHAGDNQLFSARYTDLSGNYPANGNIIVNVTRATGIFIEHDHFDIIYNSTLTLANLSLQSGYVWDSNLTTALNAGNHSIPALYTNPNNNYTTASGSITVNVAKAPGVFGTHPVINTTFTAALILANLTLQNGYAWNNALTPITHAGDGQIFSANYNDPSNNYELGHGSITVNVAKAAGAVVSAPTLASRTDNSITINAVPSPDNEQIVEYARNTINTAPADGWQTELTFNGLSAGTNYYIFARSKGNTNYETGNAVSVMIATLVQESFTITFENFTDINATINAGTIYLVGGTGRPLSTTITINNPQQYDTGSIKWYYNDSQITNGVTGTRGEILTVNSYEPEFNNIGYYSVTVEMKIDGKQYSKVVTFEVRP